MKRYLLIFALLLGAAGAWGQSSADQNAVLQKCITAPEAGSLLTFDPTGVPVSLFAVQGNATLPANLKVDYFGKPLQMTTEVEVVSKSIGSFYRFNTIAITAGTAQVSFEVWYNLNAGKQSKLFDIRLQKTGGQWNIVETKVNGK